MLIAERRENADAIDVPLQKAIDGQLIKALNDFYLFDLDVGQGEVLEHLQLALHLDERDATLAMAELIAHDYLHVVPGRSQGKDGSRTRALVRPGPKLNAFADNDLTPSP